MRARCKSITKMEITSCLQRKRIFQFIIFGWMEKWKVGECFRVYIIKSCWLLFIHVQKHKASKINERLPLALNSMVKNIY